MQKRKSEGGTNSSHKKKRLQSPKKDDVDKNVEGVKHIGGKPRKTENSNDKFFKKGGLKDGKKFSSDGPMGAKKNNAKPKGGKNFKGDNKISSNYKGKKPDPTKGKNPKFSKEKGTEKPVWSEMKKEKKELRIVRRKAKSTAEVFELSHKAKLLSAQIQRKTVKLEFKNNACMELHILLKGNYKNIALTHDLSRVIQVLLKHSPDNIKNEISEEVLDIMVQMVQSKYAQHAVKRILKYGTEFIKHEVIKKFLGHIVTLAAHTISAPVLDFAYGEYATPKEKQHMQQEFYGDIYKNSKDDSVKTLSDSYKGSPEMKAAILSSCKANIQRILDKNLHDGELLHSVLYDYIRECSAEDRVELVSTLSPLIVPLSNSLPGVNAASICVWQGTNKDKKTILKVVKEHAVQLSTHKTGYRLLLAIFDAVDDTVLVKKAIVAAIAAGLKDVAKDHWGRMTLHWLVKPSDTAAFHPNLIKFLKEGAKSGSSKKDADIRVSELREAILPALKTEIQAEPEFWLSDPTIALLTTAILSIESTQEMLDALAAAICRPDWQLTKDGKQSLAAEDAGMHMCLKKMAALDKARGECSLGAAVADQLTDETLAVWLPTNRGCFFLLKLIESNSEKIAKKLVKKVLPHVNILKKQSSQGAKLLIKNVE